LRLIYTTKRKNCEVHNIHRIKKSQTQFNKQACRKLAYVRKQLPFADSWVWKLYC